MAASSVEARSTDVFGWFPARVVLPVACLLAPVPFGRVLWFHRRRCRVSGTSVRCEVISRRSVVGKRDSGFGRVVPNITPTTPSTPEIGIPFVVRGTVGGGLTERIHPPGSPSSVSGRGISKGFVNLQRLVASTTERRENPEPLGRSLRSLVFEEPTAAPEALALEVRSWFATGWGCPRPAHRRLCWVG